MYTADQLDYQRNKPFVREGVCKLVDWLIDSVFVVCLFSVCALIDFVLCFMLFVPPELYTGKILLKKHKNCVHALLYSLYKKHTKTSLCASDSTSGTCREPKFLCRKPIKNI